MTHALTLHEEAWTSNGPTYASGPVIGYRGSRKALFRNYLWNYY